MNQKDKELNEAQIREAFYNVGKADDDAVKAKQAYQKRMAEIEKFKDTYSEQEIASQKQKAKETYDAARRAVFEKIPAHLEKLRDVLNQRHAELDLSDSNWQNALKLIELGVRDPDTVRKINKSFEHNQSALRALRDVYKAKGLAQDGGINDMIYSISPTFEKLQSLAKDYALGRTTITQFASKVAEVARREGVNFNGSPDPDAFAEAVSKGAGFPGPE